MSDQNQQKEDWRKVMLAQYSIFGTIAGLEITALTIFVSFGSNLFQLEEKIIFTITVALLFLEVIGILWLINQERKGAFGVQMHCFQENETTYRLILNISMVITWGLILSLLLIRIW